MNTTVKLPVDIVSEARKYASVNSRSIPKQLSHWARIGKIAEENPDLSYHFIKDLLLGMSEVENNEVTEYTFG